MPGGVEKVTCELANMFIAHGHTVTILYRDKAEGVPYFYLDPNVPAYNVLFEDGQKKISDMLPVRWKAYREFCRMFSQKKAQSINADYKEKQYGEAIRKWLDRLKPDIIISTSAQSTKYVIDDAQCEIPVITMIHSDPGVQFPALSDVECAAVARSAALQVLFPSYQVSAKAYFPDLPISVIGNPISIPITPANLNQEKTQYLITCVGSVCNNKNQKLLIRAFGNLSSEFPNWKLEIWGLAERFYGGKIQQYIHNTKLGMQAELMGMTKDVNKEVYRRTDIYAVPSKVEGFPLSLSEAMAMGIPAVGLNKCLGVSNLIRNEKTGILTDFSIEAYERALRTLMENRALRVKLGAAARINMMNYVPEKIYDQWEILIRRIIGKQG